jgi:hypothetical protein
VSNQSLQIKITECQENGVNVGEDLTGSLVQCWGAFQILVFKILSSILYLKYSSYEVFCICISNTN